VAFPVTVVDDFNRANNVSLGANWTEAVNGKNNRAEISSNQVSTATGAGASSMAAWTKADGRSGKSIACQITAAAFANTTDILGLGVTKVSDTTKGYHVEFDNLGADVVSAIINDSTATTLATVTATGYGKILAGDVQGFVALDNGATCSIEVWLGRSGVYTRVATATGSGAEYLAGDYYGALRVKYDTEFLDDFGADLVTTFPADNPPIGILGRGAGW
jgi:hypothetical protein